MCVTPTVLLVRIGTRRILQYLSTHYEYLYHNHSAVHRPLVLCVRYGSERDGRWAQSQHGGSVAGLSIGRRMKKVMCATQACAGVDVYAATLI